MIGIWVRLIMPIPKFGGLPPKNWCRRFDLSPYDHEPWETILPTAVTMTTALLLFSDVGMRSVFKKEPPLVMINNSKERSKLKTR